MDSGASESCESQGSNLYDRLLESAEKMARGRHDLDTGEQWSAILVVTRRGTRDEGALLHRKKILSQGGNFKFGTGNDHTCFWGELEDIILILSTVFLLP